MTHPVRGSNRTRIARAVVAIAAVSPVAHTPESTAVREIRGGRFEASGVAPVPGSNALLFIDDGRTREVFLMELTQNGEQHGDAVRVPIEAEITDLEGMTWADGRYYVMGSQSKLTGTDGDGLVRFTFDPVTRRVANVERIKGMKAWLAENVTELYGTSRQLGDHVLNVEGLAWDPKGRRFLLGLRAPVVDGNALIVPITMVDTSAAFTRENLRVSGPALRVPLGGAGIRSIEYDGVSASFHLISGASLNDETLRFRVVEWTGESGSPVKEIASFPSTLKPEGMVTAELNGRQRTVIVFDTGRWTFLH